MTLIADCKPEEGQETRTEGCGTRMVQVGGQEDEGARRLGAAKQVTASVARVHYVCRKETGRARIMQ